METFCLVIVFLFIFGITFPPDIPPEDWY